MRNRIMGLIVPANRNLVSLGSSLGLERMLFSVSMLFSYWCLVSSIYFRFPSFVHVRLFVVFPRFSGARNMELFLVLVGLHKKKDGYTTARWYCSLACWYCGACIILLCYSIQSLFRLFHHLLEYSDIQYISGKGAIMRTSSI